ncbi:putative ATP-dependent DEAD/H RNA helicase [Trypanosoma cruzi]|uniref:Putative ATP-dependent DEAD/H RNA helicase n=1 Tax=Trypanosoma cruzi TaxID=5693 RepID=A0A2V2UFN4_TRYCR|nr:putative ATP-dependent DEAD/H RNA helicase [Trypanosoma cruzi]
MMIMMGRTLSGRNALLDVKVLKLHGNVPQVDRTSFCEVFRHVGGAARRSPKECSAQAWLPEDCICHGRSEVCTTILRQIRRVVLTALDGQSRIGNVGDSLLFLMPHEAGHISCVRTLYRQRERDQWLFTGNEAAAANGGMIMRLVSFHHLTTLDPKGEPHVNAEHGALTCALLFDLS